MPEIFDNPFPLGWDAPSPAIFHPGFVVKTLDGSPGFLPFSIALLGILIAAIACIGLCTHCHLDPKQWSAASGKDVREPRVLPLLVATTLSIILIGACTVPAMQGESQSYDLWHKQFSEMHRLIRSAIQISASMLDVATAMSQEMSCIMQQRIATPLLRLAHMSMPSLLSFETGMATDFKEMISALNTTLAAEDSFELMFRNADNTTNVAQPIASVVLMANPAMMTFLFLAIMLCALVFKLRPFQSHTMAVAADCFLERVGSVIVFIVILFFSLCGAFQLHVAEGFSKFCYNVDPNVLAMFGGDESDPRHMFAKFAKYYIAMKGSNPIDLSGLTATADVVHERLRLLSSIAQFFGTKCAQSSHSISDVLSSLDRSVEMFHDGVKSISEMTSAANINPHYDQSVHVAFCSKMTEGLGYLSFQNIAASCVVFPIVVLLFDQYLFKYAAHLRFQQEDTSRAQKEAESLVERTPRSLETSRWSIGFFSCNRCTSARDSTRAPVEYIRAYEV
eukprot:TRINITY_DN3078_c0_g2_i1.p1 TRINITY_DN3078_c0_g2~~TRINITY_DN3078_c0_g2_i1.p1  ORF type:complete len:507 (-),score=50.46 TRINITY_DN3078_c0_g2_i1:439-1959(-)